MTNPLVTVAVPSYNQKNYLAETLDSIIAQDYRPLKIIVADDASTDGTQTLIQDYATRFPDIIVPLLHPKNLGVTANMASIYPLLEGKYVFWFAGDDVFLPGKISKQVAAMQAQPDALFSYHDVEFFSDQGSLYTLIAHPYGQPQRDQLLKRIIEGGTRISTLSLMVNREHPSDVRHKDIPTLSADWLLLIELAANGRGIYIPEILCRYRRHAHNLSRKVTLEDEDKLYEATAQEYPHLSGFCVNGSAGNRLKFIFKYLVLRQPQKALATTIILARMILKKPTLVPFLAADLTRRIGERLILMHRTGKVFR